MQIINKKNILDTVDFHAHILPGADHGCNSLANGIEQLNLAHRYGVTRIVSTPHFYPQSFSVDDFIYRREKAFSSLINSTQESCLPKVVAGAEVLMCENIEYMPDIEKLCLGRSNILLLELPQETYSFDPVRSVKALIRKGFDIVLAHADRYDRRRIDEIVECGATIQLNAPALSSFIVRKHVFEWLESGRVSCIGSDIHGTSVSHYRKFCVASKRISRTNIDVIEKSNNMWERVSD